MQIFKEPLRPINYDDPRGALKTMHEYIKYMAENLEWQLANLDSSNITEIDTTQTQITDGSGKPVISGDSILLSGRQSERFQAGYDTTAQIFRFEVSDRSGTNVMYLNSAGELVITKRATLAIDCGEW